MPVVHAVVHIHRYAIGGLIYIITSQDLSLLGYPQSVIMQQLALYWLSSDVQSNMSSMGASPLLPSYVSAVCPLPILPMPILPYPPHISPTCTLTMPDCPVALTNGALAATHMPGKNQLH